MGLLVVQERNKTKRQLYEDEVRKRSATTPDHKIDPFLTCNGQVRVERTLQLLEQTIRVEGCLIADLGCGSGVIASCLARKGASVTGVDAANRLGSSVPFINACLPYLPFTDSSLEGLIFTDVIAELDPELYRLTLSELSRILKKEGWLLCSTPIDTESHDASGRFIELIETEFEILTLRKSFHRLHLALTQCLKAPFRFRRGSKDPLYRLHLLQKRSGVMRLWFYVNTIRGISWIWKPAASLCRPLLQLFQKDKKLLLLCESFSKILWRSASLTHLIILARKRQMR